MTVVGCSWVRRAQGREPGAGPRRATWACRSWRRVTCSGRPSRPARRSGREADRYMSRGQLVPGRDDRPGLPRPARAARRPGRRDPRRLPPDAGPGRGARRRARRGRPAGRSGDLHRRPDRGPRPADGQPPDLHGERPRLQPRVEPAARADSVCDIDGSPIVQRPDDDEETVRARMTRADPAAPRRRRALPRGRRPADRRRPGADRRRQRDGPRRVERLPAGARARAGRLMVTRKSRREIEKMRVAGRIVAEVLALVEAELQAGRHDRPPRSAGRAPHPGAPAPCRRSRATATGATRSRRASASRSTTRSSTGSPATASIRDGQIVSVDAGAIYDGWHGDGARTFVVGEPAPEVARARRHDAPGDDGRDRGRGARAHTSATSRPRSRMSPTPDGYGIVRQFVGHGIGTEMHQEPQVPNYRTGVRGHEARARASASRSSRC